MNAWPFVVAAYVLTLGTAGLLTVYCWRAMRRAERDVQDLRRR